MKTTLAALALAPLLLPAAPAAADRRADGLWRIDLTGEGPHFLCRGTIGTTGRIAGGKPVYSGRTKYGYSVTRALAINFWAARRADRAVANGRIAPDFKAANGTFRIVTRPCGGTWRAVKLGA